MKPTPITINGRTYASVAAMPDDVRRFYDEVMGGPTPLLEDGDVSGASDVVEGVAGDGLRVVTSRQFVVNGTRYHRLEDVPEEHRPAIEAAMGRLRRREGVVTHHASIEWRTASAARPGPDARPVAGSGSKPDLRLVTPGSREQGPVEIRFSISLWMVAVAALIAAIALAAFFLRH